MNNGSITLQITRPGELPQEVRLTAQRLVIGRSARNEVQLDSGTVSRHHAELYRDPFGRWWVRDLGSRNGTLVNGTRVQEHMLSSDDCIQVEEFSLKLLAGSEPRPATEQLSLQRLTITEDRNSRTRRLQEIAPPKIDVSHLAALTEFGAQLLTIELPQQRLHVLCELMVRPDFHGNAAVVVRLDKQADAGQQPLLMCEPAQAADSTAQMPYLSRTVLREILYNQVSIVGSNVTPRDGVVELSIADNLEQMSAVACPLANTADFLDVLYVSFPAQYGTSEWLALGELAARQFMQAEAAWTAREQAQAQAAIERELDRARQIQLRLIPQQIDLPGLEIAIEFEPCRWVGGDYTDVVALPDGRTLVTIADVCGKGLQAAMVTACLHTMIHSQATAGVTLQELLQRLDAYLHATLRGESFVTMICLIIDSASGEVELANAGHPPAMVAGSDQQLRDLPWSENLPLGLGISSGISTQQDRLDLGETLVLYTDGLTEMKDQTGRMVGLAGVGTLIQRFCSNPEHSLPQVSQMLRAQMSAWQGQRMQEDDCTFMLVRRRPN